MKVFLNMLENVNQFIARSTITLSRLPLEGCFFASSHTLAKVLLWSIPPEWRMIGLLVSLIFFFYRRSMPQVKQAPSPRSLCRYRESS